MESSELQKLFIRIHVSHQITLILGFCFDDSMCKMPQYYWGVHVCVCVCVCVCECVCVKFVNHIRQKICRKQKCWQSSNSQAHMITQHSFVRSARFLLHHREFDRYCNWTKDSNQSLFRDRNASENLTRLRGQQNSRHNLSICLQLNWAIYLSS